MQSTSFNKLRLGLTSGVMGSALLLSGGAVSRVQAAETKTRGTPATCTTVTRTGIGWIVCNSTSTNGITGLGLQEASYTGTTTTTGGASSVALTDAFDGCEVMEVDGIDYADPDGTLDISGNVLTGSPTSIAGLEVSREFRWNNATLTNGTAVMRNLNNFTNNGAAPIDVTVSFGCNLGSDGGTFIEGTNESTANADVPDSARWFVTSDAQPYADPPVTHVRYGENAGVIPAFRDTAVRGLTFDRPGPGVNDFVDDYAITVPPGTTVHILRYTGLSNGGGASLADAPVFESLTSLDTAGLLVGIPTTQLDNIVNYAPRGTVLPETRPVPTMNRIGLILMGGLMALAGLFGWRRQRSARQH